MAEQQIATLDLRNADAMLQRSALDTYDDAMRGQIEVTRIAKEGIAQVQNATKKQSEIEQVTEVAASSELDKIAEAMQKIDMSQNEIFGGIKGLFDPDYNVDHQRRMIDMSQFNLRRIAFQQQMANAATERLKTEKNLELDSAMKDVDLNVQRLNLMDKGLATQQAIEEHTLRNYDYKGLLALEKNPAEQKRIGISPGALERAKVAEQKRVLDIQQQQLSMAGMRISNSREDMKRETEEKARWVDLHTPEELSKYVEKAQKQGGRIQIGNAIFTTIDLQNAQMKRFNDRQDANKRTLDTLTQTLGIDDQLNVNGQSINNALSNLQGYGLPMVEAPLGADGKVDPRFANMTDLERVNAAAAPANVRPLIVRAQQYMMASRDPNVSPEYKLTYQMEALKLSNQMRETLIKQQLDSAPKGTKEAQAQFFDSGVVSTDAAAYSYLSSSLNNRNAVAHPVYRGSYQLLSDAYMGMVKKNGGQAEIDMNSSDVGMALLNIGGKKQSADTVIRQAMDTLPANDTANFPNRVVEKFVQDATIAGVDTTLAQLAANEQPSSTPMYRGLIDQSGRYSSLISMDGVNLDLARLNVVLEERTMALRKAGVLNETQSLRDDFNVALKQNIARFDYKPHTAGEAAFARAAFGANPEVMIARYVDGISRLTPDQWATMQRNKTYDDSAIGRARSLAEDEVEKTGNNPLRYTPTGMVMEVGNSLKDSMKKLFGTSEGEK